VRGARPSTASRSASSSRAGYLVVYVPGYLEDLGRVVWLLEAAERLAGRVQTEITEAVA
jgi:hypothetical protein